MSSRTTKRLLSELNDFNSSTSPGLVSLSPTSDDDLLQWEAHIAGPQDTAFEGRLFKLAIAVPASYPSQPPKITFKQPVFHPNVNYTTGEICLDVLKEQWSPVWTLSSACMAVQALLASPEASSPLNVDAVGYLAKLIRAFQLPRHDVPMPALATTKPSGSGSGSTSRVLAFAGAAHFRHRLVLSILSRRPVQIDRIRPDEDQPGLRPSEVSFLRLLEKITEGTRVEISYTGTSVLFHPGTIAGGTFTHTCPVAPGERSVGWYLEPMLALAPFGKKDLVLTLKGITTDGRDASVDTIRTSGLPHLAMFLDKEGVELRITKRGHPPLGGGEVTFSCPSVRAIKSGFDFTNVGRVSKIRGIAHSVRVSPQLSNRLVASARSVLNRYIPDVYIYTDVYRGEDSGKSPGYALTLLASSTSHVLHSSERTSCPPADHSASASGESWTPPSPEDLGIQAARELLEEIRRGGCVDRGWEWLVALMLVLGGEDVGRATMAGPFDTFFVEHLRDLRAFFGTTFKIKPVVSAVAAAAETEDGTGDETMESARAAPAEEYVLSCVGTGFTNTAKRTG